MDEKMIMLIIDYEKNFHKNLMNRFRRGKILYNLDENIIIGKKNNKTIIIASEDPLAEAFLFSAYLSAKTKKLEAKIYKTIEMREEDFNEKIREKAAKMITAKLSMKDLRELKTSKQ